MNWLYQHTHRFHKLKFCTIYEHRSLAGTHRQTVTIVDRSTILNSALSSVVVSMQVPNMSFRDRYVLDFASLNEIISDKLKWKIE